VKLPPPTNAAPLFEDTLRFIEGEIAYVASLKETLQGGRFMSEYAREAPERARIGRTVGGGRWFPDPDLTRLIGSCLVEYGFRPETVERLLEALHPNPAEANREQLAHFLYGREGLMIRVPQIAALIRGAPRIGRGVKADSMDATEHAIVFGIRARLEERIPDEKISDEMRETWELDPDEYARLRKLAGDLK